MASIKVTYGKTSRKFTIASNTTWSEFESQLHDLFNIPNETSISISYVDEDGDVITLSTDSELQQILSDQESFGANVKFNVYTSENSDNNSWVLENAEEKDDSVTTLSDDETTSNNDGGIVAYTIGEPSESENTQNIEKSENTENEQNIEKSEPTENTENTEIKEVADVQTEEQRPVVEINNYPRVTVTDEKDDPLFEPTVLKEENSGKQLEALLTPVDSINEENEEKVQKEQNQETPAESSNNAANVEKSSPEEKAKEANEESDDDSNVIFIISSSPWIQRTYYRPRVNLFNSLSNVYHYPTHFSRFVRPSRSRYSYITPSYGFRSYGSRSCGLNSRGFGGFGTRNFGGFGNGFGNSFGINGLYNFGL
ncbi:hypothetical protein C1645_743464 [Glomus cerebriforme]|uniref:PB1 domain-containing protein n=1 Tax=Glomus cerebriforme TaxID=658196 RepID=A0A397SFY0_9GLOM|nr:hypothetical protein C1645_743464 [Glomus cerebriforme]